MQLNTSPDKHVRKGECRHAPHKEGDLRAIICTALGVSEPPGDWRLWENEAAAESVPIERYLLDRRLLDRNDFLRALLLWKGRHGFQLDGDWFDITTPPCLGQEYCIERRILPLLCLGDRLYFLCAEGDETAAIESVREKKLNPVCLGTDADIDERIERLFARVNDTEGQNRRFGEFLEKQGLVAHAQIEQALEVQREKGYPLGKALIRTGALQEDTAFELLANFLNRPYYNTERILNLADDDVVRLLPRRFAQNNAVLALRIEDNTVWVVTSHPEDMELLDGVAKAVDCTEVHVAVGAESNILNLINLLYDVEPDQWRLYADSAWGDSSVGEEAERVAEEKTGIERTDVPRLVNYLLYTGVRRRASDIHIEAFENEVALRMRIDGSLVDVPENPLTLQNLRPVVTSIKVMAGLDIAERRRPQDGVIRRRFGKQAVDFRVAVQPTIWGESVVLRVLNQSTEVPTIDQLGLAPVVAERFRRLLRNPQGLILLTGPTGCGKTTTLYSALQELKADAIKIVTAEDPVEYAIDGVQQSQVNEDIGNTFSRYLRAFLRQDPDVILVGEIRDAETAEITIRAALTGHLIFSTLHVNEAVGSVRRLTDLGVAPNLLSQTLLCVISQRLARRVCSHCSERHVPEREVVREFYRADEVPGADFRRGRGCPACNHTGYRGRVALVEYWEPDEEARRRIDAGTESGGLRAAAVAGGMLPLVADALHKAEQGVTTLEELLSVLPIDQIRRHRDSSAG